MATNVVSVFTTDPAEMLFALTPGNRDEYQRVAELIEEARNESELGCGVYDSRSKVAGLLICG